ncbi:MAG: prephenate dehydratase [Candelina mexicana]|nr:MAG: prephenate dehydratase [Candelina mexicana]
MTKKYTTVAYLGPPSSYTHQAALTRFNPDEHLLKPQPSIADVFKAVQSAAVDYGVVPFENSTHGSVIPTLELLADREHQLSGIYVCDEAYLDIHHCLIGHRIPISSAPQPSGSVSAASSYTNDHSTLPALTTSLDFRHIRHVYSHPQAIGQCEAFLNRYLRKSAQRHEVSSTSKAAEIVAQDEEGTSAAISSEVAAQTQGLDILARSIEDRDDNTTRFLVLRNRNDQSQGHTARSVVAGNEVRYWKTLVSFTIDQRSPGTLVDVLKVFERWHLRFTGMNSRPSWKAPWHYVQFVELGGRMEQDPEKLVQRARLDLTKVTQDWRCLGSWRSRANIRY